MTPYPSIDIKDRKAYIPWNGEDSPLKIAKIMDNAGFEWIHLVDLDTSGESPHDGIIQDILTETNLKIQLSVPGGHCNDIGSIQKWLHMGIKRFVFGYVAIINPAYAKSVAGRFRGRIAVGIDCMGNVVSYRGQETISEISTIDTALLFEDSFVSHIICTDIWKDGRTQGINVDTVTKVANSVSIPVIAAGGMKSTDEIPALKSMSSNIEGVICGKALYENVIDVEKFVDIQTKA